MKKFLGFFLLLCYTGVFAQDLDKYEKREYVRSDGFKLPYRILYPKDYNKSKKYPLILFLHGAGERGNDNEKQLTHGAKLFLKDENRENFPCIVIAPQCPTDNYWASVKVDRSTSPITLGFDYHNQSTTPMLSFMDIVKQVCQDESVDKSRLYIIGLSMGGMGTFETVYRYPKVFAAAIPICGGGDVEKYDKSVKRTSFWVFHGDADQVVDVNNSRKIVEKLKQLKIDVKYTEYPNVKHNSWDNVFQEPDLLPWLFAHKRKKVQL
ncbi:MULTISPECIES: prolyl oligopeptidase family serine peptidase [unclassified Arcicella]|uniref:carboxylesterase family protein n=1 Tax=unclassified Arcicella TaxID=2644986 RepID=UPI002861AA7C|nr:MULTISPECIES: prolyl oligopeptidase family serine peptidase [unclassified Arcicella]MDR6561435.1 putative peptidase [Arcicella sp. BE51]MDR6811319.1 putative peptidase [Arcicella sp. BE140]MDR6822669.1 putative peptidase [Arcicella sp. BE139]